MNKKDLIKMSYISELVGKGLREKGMLNIQLKIRLPKEVRKMLEKSFRVCSVGRDLVKFENY